MFMISERVRNLEMSGIRKMFDAAPEDAINLGLGEPDFSPPEVVKEALFQAVREGFNKYGPSRGILPLRDTIARIYEERYGPASRDNVLVTIGGSEALAVAALSLYETGDEVLVPNPGFVLYSPHARMADARPVPYSLKEENSFLPDFGEIESKITRRTKAIVVNSPSNPTGTVYSRRVVDRLVDLALKHDLTIISDEVYEEIQYLNEPYSSFWGRLDNVIVVNSFSKIFALTGWRLGYMLGEKEFVEQANKLHYHLVACAPTPPQIAALKGLQAPKDEVQAMVREFRARRDLIVKEIRNIKGMHCVTPTGAFYAFPSFDWNLTDAEAANALLQRGLLCTPGSAFGSLGKGHLRFSFANSRENISRGMQILSEFAAEQR
jgi:aspartate aminotransferase